MRCNNSSNKVRRECHEKICEEIRVRTTEREKAISSQPQNGVFARSLEGLDDSFPRIARAELTLSFGNDRVIADRQDRPFSLATIGPRGSRPI